MHLSLKTYLSPKKLCIHAFALTLVLTAQASAQCGSTLTAVDDTARVLPEPFVIDVLANDTDDGGGVLSVTVTNHTCDAIVTVDDFGLVFVDPQPTIGELCTLQYAVSNEEGRLDTATADIEIITGIFSSGFETGTTSEWDLTA